MRRLRVGVIYGGRSSEHEVSLASAAAVFAHLDPDRYESVPVYIDRDGRWSLPDRPPTLTSAADVIKKSQSEGDGQRSGGTKRDVHLVAHPGDETLITIQRSADDTQGVISAAVGGMELDVVFPVVHGPYGEDGTLQGLLELASVPYVGAGVLGSALAMDKVVSKTVFEAVHLPVVDYAVVTDMAWETHRSETLTRVTDALAFPLFVKPANLGSSVGVTKVSDTAGLEEAIDLARQFDRKILVEAGVSPARELEVAVLGNDDPVASVPGEIRPGGEFYDYRAKYLHDDSELVIPAPLTPEQIADIQRMAVQAFQAIDASGMARVDFLMNGETGALFLNEVNTIPGFTTISMYAKLWEASGVSYTSLLDTLIDLALQRRTQKDALRTRAI